MGRAGLPAGQRPVAIHEFVQLQLEDARAGHPLHKGETQNSQIRPYPGFAMQTCFHHPLYISRTLFFFLRRAITCCKIINRNVKPKMRKAVILVLFKLPVLSGFSFPPVFLEWSKEALLG